jgi:hypothetical protein
MTCLCRLDWSRWLVGLAVAAACSAAEDAPVGSGPSPSPAPTTWEFDFTHEPPQRIEVLLEGDEAPTTYWYMLYTVRNPGLRTQRFFPTFELVTDDLTVLHTDVGISPLVFNAIKERHRRTHPYLVPPAEAIGPLKIGDDNAIESVAIWRADELTGNSFDVFVAGLSGETRIIPNPAYDPDQPASTTIEDAQGNEREISVNPRNFTLRKTLQLTFRLPGSETARRQVKPVPAGRRWILR